MVSMRLRAVAVCVLLLAGCSDDPPEIRNLKYSPNAAITGVMASISGGVNYTDSDGDISQTQLELIDPSGASIVSSPTPIQDVTQGALGNVAFTLTFTPPVEGIYHFNIWIIDLLGRQSNKIFGVIRVSNP